MNIIIRQIQINSFVLIETLWNVNTDLYKVLDAVYGINRNIVECKYRTGSTKNNSNPVLIETLWNVNLKKLLIMLRYLQY